MKDPQSPYYALFFLEYKLNGINTKEFSQKLYKEENYYILKFSLNTYKKKMEVAKEGYI